MTGKKDANVWMIGPLAGSKDPMSSDKSIDDAGEYILWFCVEAKVVVPTARASRKT